MGHITTHKTLARKLKNHAFIETLLTQRKLNGYTDNIGRVTFNKEIANKNTFGHFSDIIASLIPLDIAFDADSQYKLPSLARILEPLDDISVYKQYLFMNATMDEFMDYEDEEDNQNMDALLQYLYITKARAVVGITVQKSEAMGSTHASAFVVWKKSTKVYNFAYYDPLAFKRGIKSYDFAERAFRPERFNKRISFINLNEYCFHKQKDSNDFHCSQYVMNAEYCYIYALFFLQIWLKQGGKLHRASFRKAIVDTYVVQPAKLSRADNFESMVYRVTLIAFVCQSMLKFLTSLTLRHKRMIKDVDANVARIKQYLRHFKDQYGVSLVKHARTA